MSGSAGARTVLGQLNMARGPDNALLRPGIRTSVTGVRQVLQALEKGSKEVRKYLLDEVNVVYECKVCMNFFRSLANLTAHKRSYCLEQFVQVTHVFDTCEAVEAAQLQTVVVQAEEVDAVFGEEVFDIENYSPSLELLKDAGVIREIENVPVVTRLFPQLKAGLSSVVDRLAAKARDQQRANLVKEVTRTDGVCLEPIKQTSEAQFQSWTTGFEYQEVQRLNSRDSTIAVGPNGQELPRGDMDGALKRSNSPTSSDSSKENIEEEDNNNLAGLTRYPCPVCKKAFTKVGNVYKHLAANHNKTKEQYLKMSKTIRNNAFIEEKTDNEEVEVPPPKLVFNKAKQTEDALQLAIAVGLVNRNGTGMQKVTGRFGRPKKNPLENGRVAGDFVCDHCGYVSISEKGLNIHKGLGKCKRNVRENLLVNHQNGLTDGHDSDDEEVSFNIDKETSDSEMDPPEKKRKRVELTKREDNGANNNGDAAWNDGAHQCQLCDKSFRTPTFLIQHYTSPHFRNELRNEFAAVLATKKCFHCNATFDNDTKLLMHLGATHREVNKYLPSGVAKPKVGPNKSPTKKVHSKVEDPLQKLLATAVARNQTSTVDSNIATNAEDKKSSKESPSTSPPVKRPPGRPPGSPNKVKKNPASPPVAKPPQDTVSTDFTCQCGFSSGSERGLNIHRALGRCTSPKLSPDKIKTDLTCAQCGFESVSERGLKIHRAIGKCISPKPPSANSQSAKHTSSPKNNKDLPEIEDEFMM